MVQRVNAELNRRGYLTWFDLVSMKGNTIEAMSAAIDSAEIFLYAVSIFYKESANCRLEANYAHQIQCDMVPLLMEKDYQPKGWLGMLLGTRLYYLFAEDDVADEAVFQERMDALVREIGDRGRCNRRQSLSEAASPRVAFLPGSSRTTSRTTPRPEVSSSRVAEASENTAAAAPAAFATPAAGGSRGGGAIPYEGSFTPSIRSGHSSTPSTAAMPSLVGAPVAEEKLNGQLLALVEKQHAESREREDTLWREAVAQRDERLRELRHEVEQLRAELRTSAARAAAAQTREAAISDEQLTRLLARIGAIRSAKLLSGEDCDTLEDLVADYVDL
eukprot:SAG11_NODE_2357_length_3468_cov_1.841199_1_plen_331_part_10